MTERELQRAVRVLNACRGRADGRFDRTWQKLDRASLLPRVWFDDDQDIYVVLAEAPKYSSWFEGILNP